LQTKLSYFATVIAFCLTHCCQHFIVCIDAVSQTFFFCELRKDLFFRSRNKHKDALHSLAQLQQQALNITVTKSKQTKKSVSFSYDCNYVWGINYIF